VSQLSRAIKIDIEICSTRQNVLFQTIEIETIDQDLNKNRDSSRFLGIQDFPDLDCEMSSFSRNVKMSFSNCRDFLDMLRCPFQTVEIETLN